MTEQRWQTIAKSVQDHLAATIAAVQPSVPDVPLELPGNVTTIPHVLLPKDVLSITEEAPEALLSKLAAGSLSSVQVTKAFLQRAGLASKLTKCVTELLPDRALQRAKVLDDYLQQHGKPLGPLHGLPVSVKELASMKGLDVNVGYVAWVGQPAEEDALILKLLWDAGCVFHARTTESQAVMHLETSNNLFGVTVNPYNTKLTCGGSSGGEGALLGMRGSCLGVGTDIGGSIRSPAANNGVFGLRPTTYRLPLNGLKAPLCLTGAEHIVAVVGPLSTSLEGVKLFMRALLDQQPWLYEPSLVPIPWRDTSHTTLLRTGPDGRRKLRIGVLADDGIVKPHPPIQRGLDTLVSRLRDHPDIDIVPFPPYRHDEAWFIISSLYFADGGADQRKQIDASGEPWRPLSNWILNENPNVKALTVPQVWELTARRNAYRTAYAQHWNSIGTGLSHLNPGEDNTSVNIDAAKETVDVILCPVGPGCAPPLDCARYWQVSTQPLTMSRECTEGTEYFDSFWLMHPSSRGYTSQWNLLDYPALVFPTGQACGPEDKVEASYQPRNEQDEYNYKLYSPETYVDAPISLQLVGRRYEDEKVIEALELMQDIAGLPKHV